MKQHINDVSNYWIKCIDDALGKYYKPMRGNNSNCYDRRNKANPADCALTEFTDDFPFNNELTEEQQKLSIFKILQHCHKYGFDIRIKYGFDPLSDEPIIDVLGNVDNKLNENNLKNINVTLSATRKPDNINAFEAINKV